MLSVYVSRERIPARLLSVSSFLIPPLSNMPCVTVTDCVHLIQTRISLLNFMYAVADHFQVFVFLLNQQRYEELSILMLINIYYFSSLFFSEQLCLDL